MIGLLVSNKSRFEACLELSTQRSKMTRAASVARVRKDTAMMDDFGPVAAMYSASIAYEYRLFLNGMSALSMSGAWVDGVFVV